MESPQRTTFALLIGLVALLLALAVTAVVAGTSYGKPPDLNGEARAVEGSVVDIRSPDRQEPAPEPSAPAFGSRGDTFSSREVISPDAADAGAPGRAPAEPGVPSERPRPAIDPADDGLEWWSAVAGAGAMIAIGLAGLMAHLTVTRRRGAPGTNPTTVAAGH